MKIQIKESFRIPGTLEIVEKGSILKIQESSLTTIYHGDNFGTRRLEPNRMNSGNNQEGIGVYFTKDISVARDYGSKVVSLDIDQSKFLPSREHLGYFLQENEVVKFLSILIEESEDFWYLLSDYGIEVSEPEEVETYHLRQLYAMMKDGQIRNFQTEIADQLDDMDLFLKAWKECFKWQGTYNEDLGWYAVIWSDNQINEV